MRRLALLALVTALVATGCSGDDDAASTTTTSAASTTSTTAEEPASTTTTTSLPIPEELSFDGECSGIGALGTDAELTWLADGQVLTASPAGEARCIASYSGPPSLTWGGRADRLLLGRHSILAERGVLDVVPADRSVVSWSRPTGRAVVARDEEGALSKLSLGGDPELDLALPFTDGDVEYHPSGTAIALVSHSPGQTYPPDLLIASNTGEDVRWLVTNESADSIGDLAFTASGDIVFTATHGDATHLHHLVIGSDVLDTWLHSPAPVHDVVASPWDDELVAAGIGRCGRPAPMWLNDTSTTGDLDGTAVAEGTPVGWLPDGSLAVLVRDDGCDDTPGDLYVVRDGDATLVAEQVEAAAVRAQLPPPPPPPPEIEAAPA